MTRKVISLLILLALLVSCSLSTGGEFYENASAMSQEQISGDGGQPISLYKASATSSGTYNGMGQLYRTIEIVVENIGYEKVVAVHHQKSDSSWIDIPAHFIRTLDNTCELWRVSSDDFIGLQSGEFGPGFALKYTVNGTTWWDNNDGADYQLGPLDGTLLGTSFPVLLNSSVLLADNDQTNFFGSINLQNIAYDKKATIVYTTNNWTTYSELSAVYKSQYQTGYSSFVSSPNCHNVEYWSFGVYLEGQVDTVEFAVKYEVNGTTYWDNNFTANYTATK